VTDIAARPRWTGLSPSSELLVSTSIQAPEDVRDANAEVARLLRIYEAAQGEFFRARTRVNEAPAIDGAAHAAGIVSDKKPSPRVELAAREQEIAAARTLAAAQDALTGAQRDLATAILHERDEWLPAVREQLAAQRS
jgi:hypothetical protein